MPGPMNSQPPYVKTKEDFVAKYTGGCYCGNVTFEIAEDAVGRLEPCSFLGGAKLSGNV